MFTNICQNCNKLMQIRTIVNEEQKLKLQYYCTKCNYTFTFDSKLIEDKGV